jgi:Bacterial DNA-binding protein
MAWPPDARLYVIRRTGHGLPLSRTVRKMKVGKASNSLTCEPIKVKARKTVRFKASPELQLAV